MTNATAGAAVTVALVAASVMPLAAGAVFDASGTVVMFVLIAIMYAIMAVATYSARKRTEPSWKKGDA